jgi:hypothetical protein
MAADRVTADGVTARGTAVTVATGAMVDGRSAGGVAAARAVTGLRPWRLW